ncbi:MAG: hypothetical protein ABIG10_00895 [bacterium]
MLKKIKTTNASNVISQDLLLLLLGVVVGLIIPFMAWLWITIKLAQMFLSKVA